MKGKARSDALRELRRLLDDVAEIDWRHPAWWLAVGGTALLEPRGEGKGKGEGDPDRDYLNTDGDPRSDTFMGRPAPGREETPAHQIARAVARARAALEALAALDGTLPRQPLGCHLERRGGLVQRRPLPRGAPRVAFATPAGAFLAHLSDELTADVALAGDLGRILAGRPPRASRLLSPIDPEGSEATRAAIAIGVGEESLATCRHLHRRAWSRGGGPWLGVANARSDAPTLGSAPLEVVTTSHLTVDGYGHSLLAAGIFSREDRAALTPLIEAARFGLGEAAPSPLAAPPLSGSQPLGVAIGLLEPEEAQLAPMAYALGRTLEQVYRSHWPLQARRRARFSPTFQVPVAPGAPGDALRRRRRVVPGLLSIRMSGGRFEPFESFRRRAEALLERERRAAGVLTRMLLAAQRAPVPTAIKRRLIASSAEPKMWLPLVEVLAGRGCLSSLRFPRGERPDVDLYAVSSPALSASAGEALGGSVLTAIHGARRVAVAVSGTGVAGTEVGARAFLDVFREERRALGSGDAPAGVATSS